MANKNLHAQYDTIRIYDTVKVIKYVPVYDTVYYIEKQHLKNVTKFGTINLKPTYDKMRKKRIIYKDLPYVLSMQYDFEGSFRTKNIESTSHNYTLLGQYETNRWIFGAGIAFRDEIFNQRFDKTFTIIDSTSFYETETYEDMLIDTIEFIDISNWPDTSIIYVFDTTYQTITDSSLVTEYDTIQNQVRRNSQIKIQYVGVPLFFGYQFLYKNIELIPFGGITFYIPTYTAGFYTDNQGYKLKVNRNKLQYTFIQLSTGINIKIHWTKNWSSSILGGLRINANNIFNDIDKKEFSNFSYFAGLNINYTF
jgi:hypothetical protein